MDVGHLLKDVNSLNEYIVVTQYSSEKCRKARIQLNISTILALKKIRSFEVEYVNKCEEMGIASIIFERMLLLPPSKTWGVLSKEIVDLIQYWLDSIRKHLVKHGSHWWTFLKLLLRFLKEIQRKDSSLPNIIVENTSECLFDLATADRPDVMQRYEILHYFNMCCSESSRELRYALRNKFSQYFIKLANYMSNCGNLPTQYSIMETLLRWLLPRQNQSLKIASAAKWFPAKLYARNVVDIFLERSWMNFFQDTRDFLNTHNVNGDLITSVICRKLTVGDIKIIRDIDKRDSWLDLNLASKCISLLLDPRLLDEFGCTNHKSFETLIMTEDNTHSVKLSRESDILTLSMQTVSPPQVLPSCIKLGDDVSCHVTAIVSSRADIKRLDAALRMIFETKYQLLLDLEKETIMSPPTTIGHSNKNSEEDARFSHPVEVRRRKHSGYIVRPRGTLICASPSTASTSSLAQLHENLAVLPEYKFEKERQRIYAQPNLSIVTEVSEADDRSTATQKCRAYGVCFKKSSIVDSERKSQSDSEINRCPESKAVTEGKQLSSVVRDDTSDSLIVATFGSADDSVINQTIERLSKSKTYDPDNILYLLVQEARNAKLEKNKEKIDKDFKIGEKVSQEVIENKSVDKTPHTQINLKRPINTRSEIVPSTTDESNTEAISDTPNEYVNTRRKKKDTPRDISSGRKCFDGQLVETFFSQHLTENREQAITISPRLARKVNETSSESDEDPLDDALISKVEDQNLNSFNFNDFEVIECLNDIVDRVCEEFNKCCAGNSFDLEDELPLKNILSNMQNVKDHKKIINKKAKQSKAIKLRYKVLSKRDSTKINTLKKNSNIKVLNKLTMEDNACESTKTNVPAVIESNFPVVAENNGPVVTESNVSAVLESDVPLVAESNEPAVVTNIKDLAASEGNVHEISKKKVANNRNNLGSVDTEDPETPTLRKKRKLFSPKNEVIATNSQNTNMLDANTPKISKPGSSYKPYKDIEQERQRYIRMPRNKKSRKDELPSPRSKKMNELFDKVLESTNCEQVKLVNKTSDVYNFSSDSEGDFKKKKIAIRKKPCAPTTISEESVVLTRGRAKRHINYSDKKGVENKKKVSRQQSSKTFDIESVNDLIDEKMRENKEVLDTSIVIETSKIVQKDPVLVLEKPPEMEAIPEVITKNDNEQQKTKNYNKNIKTKVVNTAKPNKRTANTSTTDRYKTKKASPELADPEDRKQQKAKGGKKTKPKLVKDTQKTLNLCSVADRTESSLSELIVEDALTTVKEDCDLSANKLLEKIREKCINKSNNTQNLLTDIENIMESSQTLNATDELFVNTKEEFKRKPIKPSAAMARTGKKKTITTTNTIEDVHNLTSSESERKSENSIATVGIDGHGDSGEAPPNSKLIVEHLEHRNLETEYLDTSTKDYFEKLTNDINMINTGYHNNSNDNNTSILNRSGKQNKAVTRSNSSHSQISLKSAVVSIERISLEDISRWLPSRRNSESDDNSVISTKSKILQKNITDSKIVESKHTMNSEKDHEVIEDIESLLSLKQKKSSESKIDTNEERNNTVIKNSQSNESIEDYFLRMPKKTRSRILLPRSVKCKPVNCNISPIKSFKSYDKNVSQLSPTSLSDDEEFMNDIKTTAANIVRLRQSYSQSSDTHTKELRHAKENKAISQKKISQFFETESIQDNVSTSTKITHTRTSKRKLAGDRDDCKRKKVEPNDVGNFISLSGNTVSSSVDDWLKRNEPSGNLIKELHFSARDSLQNVMEKLDTTLVEIHQNTSKKLVHLFVTTQEQLRYIKEARCSMYKEIAGEVLAGVVRLLDDKFAELDKRSQEQDMSFMKQLKEQTAAVIREDCKRKRVMVQILKEDVQRTLEHMKKNTNQCFED